LAATLEAKTKSRTVKAGPRQAEFDVKIDRIRMYLNIHRLSAVALSTQALFAWATAGGDNHVNQASEVGIAHLLVTPDSITVLSNNIEISRLATEEFNGIDASKIEFWSCPWHQDSAIVTEILRRTGQTPQLRWGSDNGLPGSVPLGDDFSALTYQLTDNEVERYRKLGKDCSKAMEAALERVKPGMTEFALAGAICDSLLERLVRPHVILVSSDERVYKFRHPTPTPKKIKKHLMAVLCGKRGGLIINLTRMLHFGKKLPDDLRRKHDACCAVEMAFNCGTQVGDPMNKVFAAGVSEYQKQGFGEEWKLHHQGGPTGYFGRCFRATPTEERTVLNRQAFAWNPSITGTKSEDTILVTEDGFEFLSEPTTAWPGLKVKFGNKVYRRADIRLE
jgi:antitoxin VapB